MDFPLKATQTPNSAAHGWGHKVPAWLAVVGVPEEGLVVSTGGGLAVELGPTKRPVMEGVRAQPGSHPCTPRPCMTVRQREHAVGARTSLIIGAGASCAASDGTTGMAIAHGSRPDATHLCSQFDVALSQLRQAEVVGRLRSLVFGVKGEAVLELFGAAAGAAVHGRR